MIGTVCLTVPLPFAGHVSFATMCSRKLCVCCYFGLLAESLFVPSPVFSLSMLTS